jgi:hypothetical protein
MYRTSTHDMSDKVSGMAVCVSTHECCLLRSYNKRIVRSVTPLASKLG